MPGVFKQPLLLFLLILTSTGCDSPEQHTLSDINPGTPGTRARSVAEYIGRDTCSGCHPVEAELYADSHHDLAMQHADSETVLGDFEDSTFSYNGITTTFYRREGKYYSSTDGPDGALQEFEINYTFGVFPLQQYLAELPGRRLQALSIAWDSRTKEQGGQRWFHLYPDETIDYRDALHWTGINQNWNTMCAACHTTALHKNFNPATNTYQTSWSEPDVSCEACHGPASIHVDLAEHLSMEEFADIPLRGFATGYSASLEPKWSLHATGPTAVPDKPPDPDGLVEICAPCHAHRITLDSTYRDSNSLFDTHMISLLEPDLYYADGQIEGEVFVYGSFVQSRMYHAGVTCINCHEPHSLQLRAEGNGLCIQCHRPETYDTQQHHFHPPDSSGSLCISCHMSSRTYMQVDVRHDHSFRIPRPDLSIRTGVPNACNQCHTGQSAAWATASIRSWYGKEGFDFHYGEALHAARTGQAGAQQLLLQVAAAGDIPAIVRATALGYLGNYPGVHLNRILVTGLDDASPMVRIAALNALAGLDTSERYQMAAPLLQDPIKSVRIQAARLLAASPRDALSSPQRQVLDTVIQEYITAQHEHADRAWAQLNLGNLYTEMGQYLPAETAYQTAMDLEPDFIPAYVNLADLYRLQGKETRVADILRDALSENPGAAAVYQALGLSLARQQQYDEALRLLARAVALEPENSRNNLVYAIALHSLGQTDRALEILETAHKRQQENRDILVTLATIYRDLGERAAAMRYTEKLVELFPEDPRWRRLMAQLATE
jgi:tetratricopeptide (TPR) repeat protein